MRFQESQESWDDSRDRVRRMSKEEIIELFMGYDFRDQLGHPLVNCVDFQELLAMAMQYRRAQALVSHG